MRKAAACWFVTMLLAATVAAGHSVEEELVAKLAQVTAESDRRAATFMKEVARRQAALRLSELTTPENLASRTGRDAIRSGNRAFEALIDDIESFTRGEEAWVEQALTNATQGFPPGLAAQARRGYLRGYAKSSERHAALRAAQRASTKAALELLDVIDRAPGGVHFANGRLSFPDRETGRRVSHLLSELTRLELEEQRAEREIENRRAATQQRHEP